MSWSQHEPTDKREDEGRLFESFKDAVQKYIKMNDSIKRRIMSSPLSKLTYLPNFGTDLITALSFLNVNNLAHPKRTAPQEMESLDWPSSIP